jgi:alpha,alpha-trehalase
MGQDQTTSAPKPRSGAPISTVVAVIFDTDGVVTRTASVHAAAWKEMFDAFLGAREAAPGESGGEMTDDDYLRYVDGRARFDGVEAFLVSRGVALAYGEPDDPPERETICGLGNRKNEAFAAAVRDRGVEPFESTLALARRLQDHGIRTGVVSASENCAAILEAAGATDCFETRVDGIDAHAQHLAGKPDPALFLEAAARLGVRPEDVAIVEDALVGVEAGRRGGFGLVVGVDRNGQASALIDHGADIVVPDLAWLEIDGNGRWRTRAPHDH